MKCQNCGKEIPDTAKVCGYCGTRQAIKPAEKNCPQCKALVPFDAKVCGNCGHHFDVEEKTSLIKEKPVEEKVVKKTSEKEESFKKPVTTTAEEKPAKTAQRESVSEPSQSLKQKPLTGNISLPKWFMPALLWLLPVLAAAIYFLFFSAPSISQMTLVFWDCGEQSVDANQPLAIYYYWLAAEEEQVDDYFKVASHSIMINDKLAAIKMDGFGDLEQDPDGVKRRYWMYIGKLQPGEYEIATTLVIEDRVFDGWDWFGPGTAYPGTTHYCHLSVK